MRQKQCSNCGRTFPTHYEWQHHGCERDGTTRYLNSLYRVDNAAQRAAFLKQAMDSLIAPSVFPRVPTDQSKRLTWVKVNAAGEAEPTKEPPPAAIGVVTGVSAAQHKTVHIGHGGVRYTRRQDGD